MSTNKSQNLNLHLWEPQDNFLRTEFNENFTALDGLVNRDRDVMDVLSYNVHRLLAQRDFDAEFQGTHKNMFVNAFRNEAQRSGASGLQWNGEHYFMLGPQAQITETEFLACITESTSGSSTGGAAAMDLTMGNVPAVLTSVKVYVMTNSSTPDAVTVNCSASLYKVNESQKTLVKTIDGLTLSYDKRQISDVYYMGDTLPVDFYLEAKTSYRLEVKFVQYPLFHLHYFYMNYPHKDPYEITLGSTTFYQGSITNTDQWTAPVSRAVGVVRYQNGTVRMSVNGKAMTRRATRTTVNCLGETCTEAEFYLDDPGTGTVTLQLDANCSTNSNMKIFDYGAYALS